MVNEQGSNSKITAIFQTQMLTFKNGITVYSHIVPLNKSAWIARAWQTKSTILQIYLMPYLITKSSQETKGSSMSWHSACQQVL